MKKYLAIIYLGSGSSWSQADTEEEAVKKAVKTCVKDWSYLFDFPKGHKLAVNIFHLPEHGGWTCDYQGMFDDVTGERIQIANVVEATV